MINQTGDILIRILADGLVIPVVLIAAVAMLRLPKTARYELMTRGIVAGLLALTFAKIASLLYQNERPFVLLGQQPGASYLDNPGFPSDHALFVFMIAFVVWVSTRNARLGGGLFILAILVALGRMLSLVHAPADVLGSLVCAVIAMILVYGRQLLPRAQSN